MWKPLTGLGLLATALFAQFSVVSTWAGETEIKKLRDTKICAACDLTRADLHDADLTGVYLVGAKLRDAILRDANLQGAGLDGADFSGAHLDNANLEKATLVGAKFVGAHLQTTNMKEAILNGADFSGALLQLTELDNAQAYGVNFAHAIFEPRSSPEFWTMRKVVGLGTLKWEDTPRAIMTLRKNFKDAGLWEDEKNITYALREQDIQNASALGAFGQAILFRLTCEWGRSPLRPLLIMLTLVLIFLPFYSAAVLVPSRRGAIWKVPDKERIEKAAIELQVEYVQRNFPIALLYGFYFSILSAFHIGWRELNIGGWIEQFTPWEYKLRGTGWVRTVAGVQSIVSVYLLALAVLSYFGRPFE